MSSEWHTLTFADAPFYIIDGDRGANYPKQHDFSSLGYCLFLNAGNVTDNGFSFSDCAFITQEKDSVLRKGKLVRHDLILTTRGTVGNVAYYSDAVEYQNIRINSGMVIFRPDITKIIPYYLYLFLRSRTFREQVAYLTSGSAQPQLPIRDMNRIEMPLPPLAVQQEICNLLGALDDRIALLRETNATLEAIAQALFKSWFVDFDPVHAKARGEPPQGMDDATAALFPDSFEESELGMIPKGWRAGELGEMLALRNERTKPSDETKSLPYVPIENIGAKTPFLAEFKSGEDANSSLILFKEGDILFGAMRPYFHKVCIAPFKGVTRTTVFTLSARNPKASAFALLLTYQDSTVDYATQHSEGSTIPYAKWKNSLERMPVLIPPDSVQEGFSEIVKSFIDRANANIQQAQTLTQLRDTLLPKLISGQLRLPEAEELLAEELP